MTAPAASTFHVEQRRSGELGPRPRSEMFHVEHVTERALYPHEGPYSLLTTLIQQAGSTQNR